LLLTIGRIGRPHGVKGEVYVSLTTDRVERLAPGSVLRAGERDLVVTASRPHQDRWLVWFEGVASREAAEAMTNVELRSEPVEDPEAVWVHELIGSLVVEVDGTERGRCVAVIANPADDIVELDTGALVPAQFVVSCRDGVTVIDPPAGLFDLV
jgi:16S rRNA processing protein RimM